MSKVVKIDRKITGYRVDRPEAQKPAVPAAAEQGPAVVLMNEKLERPEVLIGSTYKVKTPISDHAMYVTINDIVLNEGTPHEQRRPFEIFINSKNLDHFQWIVALTRIMSAVFRKGGDCTFLVEELKAVFDPKGGYWQAGGTFMPSLVAELGHIVERHLRTIGLMKGYELSEEQKKLIAEKRAEFDARVKTARESGKEEGTLYPPEAQMCDHCHAKAKIRLDGCLTCLSCGDSKCG